MGLIFWSTSRNIFWGLGTVLTLWVVLLISFWQNVIQYKYGPYFTQCSSHFIPPPSVDQFNQFLYLAKDAFSRKEAHIVHSSSMSLRGSSYCKQVFSSLGGSDLAAVMTEWYCSFSASSEQLVEAEAICPTPLCVIPANEKWLGSLVLKHGKEATLLRSWYMLYCSSSDVWY